MPNKPGKKNLPQNLALMTARIFKSHLALKRKVSLSNMLPASVKDPFKVHLKDVNKMHENGLARGYGVVHLPDQKYSV